LTFGHPATSTIIVVTEGEAEQVLDAGADVAELFGAVELLFKPGKLVLVQRFAKMRGLPGLVLILHCDSTSNATPYPTSNYECHNNQDDSGY
jgi:hypothetical protein